MSVATEPPSMERPILKTRPILIPAENRTRVPTPTKKQKPIGKLVSETPRSVVSTNRSIDSSCSSDSSSDVSPTKNSDKNGFKSSEKVAPVGIVTNGSPLPSVPVSVVRRCDWITANSDPLYASFHDEEWGVVVKDDKKLFELFILSQMLSELTWLGILSRREKFSKLFDEFNPRSISKFTDKDLKLFCLNGNPLISETKLRTIVENAVHMIKIQEEFGSFSNYCWSFVNHKPIRNEFRYARQVPVKTAKAEMMSKNMMKRGFRCVGATIVYSFMQAAGLVNDHVTSCFRYQELLQSPVEIEGSKIKGNDFRG
ncbi:DNA-3-methyladenine glycosylase 1 [Impatiens glandulifera]|uniref:DNA-3-methyladenine glycosylase 1 n=1 Tax=Impatiens glandulifera TaxID=253017 RepID=UPI001FB160BA|nr:DNA-3-methyladenine glycosylase 1 [Impatiens glandulifera]